jgi:hypothetical protein
VQIVVNCETRLCSQFLGPGDHFLQSYGAIFTDRAATGSGNLKNSMSTSRYLLEVRYLLADGRVHLGTRVSRVRYYSCILYTFTKFRNLVLNLVHLNHHGWVQCGTSVCTPWRMV